MAQTVSLLVTAQDPAWLRGIIDDRRRPVKHIERAQIVLLSADHLPVLENANRVGISRPTMRDGGSGSLRRVLRVCCATRRGRPARCLFPRPRCMPWLSAPWARRRAPSRIGPIAPWPRPWGSLRTIQRIWQAHKLQPHRIRTFERSTDPDFPAKLDDVVRLYMEPAPPRGGGNRSVFGPVLGQAAFGAASCDRTIKDATLKVFHYPDIESLKAHVLAFVQAYNFAKHLKALRWKTPFEAIAHAWTNDPLSFKINPRHLIPGPNT